jgi:hypothetical protein
MEIPVDWKGFAARLTGSSDMTAFRVWRPRGGLLEDPDSLWRTGPAALVHADERMTTIESDTYRSDLIMMVRLPYRARSRRRQCGIYSTRSVVPTAGQR